MRLPYVLWATVAAVALFATPACTKVVTGHPTLGASVANGNECKSVSAPLTPIESHAAAEPQLKIPQPSGWQQAPRLDSDVIRFTMRNKALSARSFMPTAVVTLEAIPGQRADVDAIFDQEQTALVHRLGAKGLRVSATTLCGDKAELVDYNAPAMGRKIPRRTARTLMVAAAFNDKTYVATVTVQSTDPTNPAYISDTDTILTGFQILSPEGG
jgi:Probable lipoprotein LpqN